MILASESCPITLVPFQRSVFRVVVALCFTHHLTPIEQTKYHAPRSRSVRCTTHHDTLSTRTVHGTPKMELSHPVRTQHYEYSALEVTGNSLLWHCRLPSRQYLRTLYSKLFHQRVPIPCPSIALGSPSSIHSFPGVETQSTWLPLTTLLAYHVTEMFLRHESRGSAWISQQPCGVALPTANVSYIVYFCST